MGADDVRSLVTFAVGRESDHPLPEAVDAAVRPVDVPPEIVGRRRASAGGFDQSPLLEHPQRVPGFVIRNRELLGELDDPDRFVSDHHPKHP